MDHLVAQVKGTTGNKNFYVDNIDETQWHFVALVKNTNSVSLYLDGSIVGTSNTATGDSSCTGHQMRLGKNENGGDRYSGIIDDVRVYTEALAEDELDALYAMGV